MKWSKLSIRKRLLLVMVLSGFVELLILSVAGFYYIKNTQEQEMGEKALGLARFLGNSPSIVKMLESGQVGELNTKLESLTQAVGATFIVIGDANGIRLVHPSKDRLGLPMKGGDNVRALKLGEAYISFAEGSLGHSVRGKTAIFDSQGNIIGVVSVGYLLDSLKERVEPYLVFLLCIAVIVVLLNGLLSNYAYKRFRKTLLGFEPEEISRLYSELDTTLSTIKEGVISVDHQCNVRIFNARAAQILGVDANQAINRPLAAVLPESELTKLLKTHTAESDIDLLLNNVHVVANRQPISVNGQVIGAVSSFRPKTEITELTRQLSQTKQYAELLRSQTHEYRNKLNTISGLLHLERIDKVQELIGQESQHYQRLISQLHQDFQEPLIAGLILGKIERGRELGLSLQIEEGSHLSILPAHIQAEDIVTILGNLIDNAFDASQMLTATEKTQPIEFSVSDYGDEIIIEVRDFAAGLPADVSIEKLFNLGVTSKTVKGHGIGLHLVKEVVNRYHGTIEADNAAVKGAVFAVFIPKSGGCA
ncbi:ATP-binding protein [Vibrio scophthalmi]|uniref:histidine kinase n=1 Tax=Vibrio scophthalmi LMG 19158 TaxID=870967 RepID=F9RLW9_9VIBR|nr:sensor histidine kinase [Vibrio scophthalmi]EGU38669.1 Signal transduction histidine kinase regulating citrate/malate metabolism [Vibrio scophthalmi LMG 19158]